MSTSTTTPDFATIKDRQQRTWSSGDYAVIGTSLQITGELLCEAVDLDAGARVLDVAAGNGNAALAAARRGADVVACDYVDALLEGTAARAAAEGVRIETRRADAEALPFADASFDVVLSTFGVMFTPQHDIAAGELARVCRPGGRIGLANWTPDSFVGRMFAIVGSFAPPPAGVRSPLQWGTEAHLAELFADRLRSLEVRRRQFVFRYVSAEQWLTTFRTFYGPLNQAFAALDPAAGIELEHELLALAASHDTSTTGALRIPSDYAEVVAMTK